mmetsp:Transcript_3347/g.8043  ORF Transcript_3347/g.8043 Transcript_3347/m.8043 type:complete len:267 (-) Transcript_3347:480-1280(-)
MTFSRGCATGTAGVTHGASLDSSRRATKPCVPPTTMTSWEPSPCTRAFTALRCCVVTAHPPSPVVTAAGIGVAHRCRLQPKNSKLSLSLSGLDLCRTLNTTPLSPTMTMCPSEFMSIPVMFGHGLSVSANSCTLLNVGASSAPSWVSSTSPLSPTRMPLEVSLNLTACSRPTLSCPSPGAAVSEKGATTHSLPLHQMAKMLHASPSSLMAKSPSWPTKKAGPGKRCRWIPVRFTLGPSVSPSDRATSSQFHPALCVTIIALFSPTT